MTPLTQKKAGRLAIVVSACCVGLLPLQTRGAPVDFDPVVGTITGQDVSVAPFIVGPDTNNDFTAMLSDLNEPVPFTFLGLAIYDEDQLTGDPLAFLDQPGTLNFTVDPGNYLAVVGGIAGGDLNIGTFGLEISNVPLPPAMALLASALAAVSFLGRRRVRNASAPAAA